MPDEIDPETQSSLQSAAAMVIEAQINPALQALLDFLETDYLPAARPPAVGRRASNQSLRSRAVPEARD